MSVRTCMGARAHTRAHLLIHRRGVHSFCVACTVGGLARSAHAAPADLDGVERHITAMHDKVRRYARTIRAGGQEDAHEYLTAVLQALPPPPVRVALATALHSPPWHSDVLVDPTARHRARVWCWPVQPLPLD